MRESSGVEEREALIAAIDRHEVALRRSALRLHGNPLLDSGITMQQFRLLMLLSVTDRVTQNDIATELGVALTTVTGLVDRLAKRGLVSRVADENDRRVRRATLSPEGRELIERILEAGSRADTGCWRRSTWTRCAASSSGCARCRRHSSASTPLRHKRTYGRSGRPEIDHECAYGGRSRVRRLLRERPSASCRIPRRSPAAR